MVCYALLMILNWIEYLSLLLNNKNITFRFQKIQIQIKKVKTQIMIRWMSMSLRVITIFANAIIFRLVRTSFTNPITSVYFNMTTLTLPQPFIFFLRFFIIELNLMHLKKWRFSVFKLTFFMLPFLKLKHKLPFPTLWTSTLPIHLIWKRPYQLQSKYSRLHHDFSFFSWNFVWFLILCLKHFLFSDLLRTAFFLVHGNDQYVSLGSKINKHCNFHRKNICIWLHQTRSDKFCIFAIYLPLLTLPWLLFAEESAKTTKWNICGSKRVSFVSTVHSFESKY